MNWIMANYKGHIGGAVIICFIYIIASLLIPYQWQDQTAIALNNGQIVAGLFVVAMLFGLWPDVDTNSKAQNIFFSLAFIVDIILIINGNLELAAYLGLLAMTPIVGKHRGWTHSKWAMVVVPLPILLVPYLYQSDNLVVAGLFYGAAVAGYFSHLLLDGLIWKKFRIKGGW